MSNVTFDVIARDRASATFRKVGVETQTLGSKLKTLVAGAGLATLGYEALRFGKDSVKAFADAQTAQAKLADAFKRFPALTDVTIGSLRDLNMALEAKTGADHNALASGEAVLAGFKLTGDQIAQIIPLVDDYAAKTGQDIPTAATGVGRALLGNTRALKSIGIEFKATGNTAQDFTTITGLLQAKLGGFATREGKTAAGQLKILQAQFRDVEEELGSALLPALVDLGHFLLHDVIPPIKSTAEFLKDNKDVVEPLAKAVLLGVAAWKAYTFWVKAAAAANVLFGRSAPAAAAGAGAAGAAGAGGFGILALGRAATLAPAAGVGTQSDLSLPQMTQKQLVAQVSALIKQLPAEMQKQAEQAFVKTASMHTTSSFLGGAKTTVTYDPAKVAALEAQWRKLVPTLNNAATGEHNVGRAAGGTTRSVQNQAKALRQLQSKALDLSQGQDDLRSAIHNMATTAGQSGRALKGNSDAALANRDALRGAVSQAENYLSVLKQHGASAEHVRSVEFNLAKAIQTSADRTYGDASAVKAFLKQLGFLPGQIQAVIDSLSALNNPQSVFVTHTEQLAQRGIIASTGKKAGSHLADSIVAGYTPVVDSGIAAASTKAADAAAAAFDKAKSKMQADTQQILGFFKQTKQELISTFSTFQTSGTDILGGSGLNANFHTQLKQGATAMHTFAHLWHRLNDLGLDPRLLAQFTGPDYIPAMREILQSGRKGIRSDNRLERQIARDARGIAQTATDDRFGRLLHHDLDTLPRKLSREMVRDLHHAKFVVEFDTGKHDRHNGRTVRQHR